MSTSTRVYISWLFPVAAWVSQFVLVMAWRGISGLGVLWLLAALVQLSLIGGGLLVGVQTLLLGRSAMSNSQWWSTVAGVVLSGGTTLLVLALIITQG